jgi:NADH:ubiquinone oxidoreductase subunit 3 (subunit A)
MCLTLRLLVNLLLLPLLDLFLFLVIVIIGALSNEMTSLTAFEAGALSPCFVLGGVLFASFECGLEAFDDECHFIFI